MLRFPLSDTGPIDVTVLKGDGEYVVRIACAEDLEEGVVHSLVVALSPLMGFGDMAAFELTFCIVSMRDGGHAQDRWDGLQTRRLFPARMERDRVGDALLTSVALLIDEANPEQVMMTTHAANLPPKALAKFHRICAVFAHHGFKAGPADPYHGRCIWMMVRQDG